MAEQGQIYRQWRPKRSKRVLSPMRILSDHDIVYHPSVLLWNGIADPANAYVLFHLTTERGVSSHAPPSPFE